MELKRRAKAEVERIAQPKLKRKAAALSCKYFYLILRAYLVSFLSSRKLELKSSIKASIK